MTCCTKYTARQMREPVTFQALTRTDDGAGGFSESWVAITGAPTRGMVKAMSGRERWASQRIEATSNYRVVVRYFAGIDAVDRILIRDRPAQVRFVNNVDLADRWLEIDVELGVAT